MQEDEKARIKNELRSRIEQVKPIADEIAYQRFRLSNLITIAVGVLFLGTGCFFFWKDRTSTSHMLRVPGIVTGFETRMTTSTNNSQHHEESVPIVTYSIDGAEKTLKGKTWSGTQLFVQGEQVQVLVDPKNADEAVIDAVTERYLPMAGVAILGLIVLIIGIRRHFFRN